MAREEVEEGEEVKEGEEVQEVKDSGGSALPRNTARHEQHVSARTAREAPPIRCLCISRGIPRFVPVGPGLRSE